MYEELLKKNKETESTLKKIQKENVNSDSTPAVEETLKKQQDALTQKAKGLLGKCLQSAARRIGSPLANQFHTCSLICILCQVHAPAQNNSDFVFRLCEKFCEAFYTI